MTATMTPASRADRLSPAIRPMEFCKDRAALPFGASVQLMSAEESVVLGFDAVLQTNIAFLSRTIGQERVEKALAFVRTRSARYPRRRCREDDATKATRQLCNIVENARP